jgi:hypothetical protein
MDKLGSLKYFCGAGEGAGWWEGVSDFGKLGFVVVKITFSPACFLEVGFGWVRRGCVARWQAAECGILAQLVICVLSIDMAAVILRLGWGGCEGRKSIQVLLPAIFFGFVTGLLGWDRRGRLAWSYRPWGAWRAARAVGGGWRVSGSGVTMLVPGGVIFGSGVRGSAGDRGSDVADILLMCPCATGVHRSNRPKPNFAELDAESDRVAAQGLERQHTLSSSKAREGVLAMAQDIGSSQRLPSQAKYLTSGLPFPTFPFKKARTRPIRMSTARLDRNDAFRDLSGGGRGTTMPTPVIPSE